MPPGTLHGYWKLPFLDGLLLLIAILGETISINPFDRTIRANSNRAEIRISGCDKSASNTCSTGFRCFPVVSSKSAPCRFHPYVADQIGSIRGDPIHPSLRRCSTAIESSILIIKQTLVKPVTGGCRHDDRPTTDDDDDCEDRLEMWSPGHLE